MVLLLIKLLGSVFCYGQTGSGKTHTMYGTKTDPGIVPRLIDDLYSKIKSVTDKQYKVTIGFLEIYNETINDLLMPSRRNLRFSEYPKVCNEADFQ